MAGNAHKESRHKSLLVFVREQKLYIIKTDRSGKMMVAFTIKEKNFLKGKLILPIGAVSFLFIFVVLSS